MSEPRAERTHTVHTTPTNPLLNFVELDGDTCTLRVHREDDAPQDETFSPQAIDAAAGHAVLWALSRILRPRLAREPLPPGVLLTVHADTGTPTAVDDTLEPFTFHWRADWLGAPPPGRGGDYSSRALAALRSKVLQWLNTRLYTTATLASTPKAMPQQMTLTVRAEIINT